MKIKVADRSLSDILIQPKEKHINPPKQNPFMRRLLKVVSAKELKEIDFENTQIRMTKLDSKAPALFLMNHSSFTDLQIAATLLVNRSYHIVMTDDGMIGKSKLMRSIGCIPTKKFIQDTALVKDMVYCTRQLNSSILMYPEASYSFDGTATPLPDSLGKLIKLLNVPVVMIRTHGAFLRDPLYNNLQKRKVKVTATEELILTKDEIKNTSADEINLLLKEHFSFDNFIEQKENGIMITEGFRADNLERVLYKCHKCGSEGTLSGKGTTITCSSCNLTHTLLENGELESSNDTTRFKFVPEWYAWERQCVREELINNTYKLDIDVDILMLVDSKSMYRIGTGHLIHDVNGFKLTGCDGLLNYSQGPAHSYSLYADYYWYEIGDMICIGDSNARYYCFPKATDNIPVAKARLATEELYKMK